MGPAEDSQHIHRDNLRMNPWGAADRERKLLMTKINRREYLRRMAAGTAGVVAAHSSTLHGRTVESDPRGNTANSNLTVNDSAAPKPDWNWTQALPGDNPGIRLIFVGM